MLRRKGRPRHPSPRPPLLGWPNTRNSPGLILVAGASFSFGPLLLRSTTGRSSAWQYLFWRFGGLSVAGCVWMLLTSRCWPLRLTRSRAARSTLGAALMAGCNICFILALERIDSATALLLQSLAPFSAALLGWLLRRERIDTHTWWCMVLAVAGVAIMGTEWGSSDPIGLLAAGGIALMLGAYAVVLRGTGEAAPEPRLQFLLNGLLGLAAVLVGLAGAHGPAALVVPLRDAACAMSAGGFCLGLGLPLYQACGRHVAPARTTLLLLSEVVLAPIWTWIFVGEIPSARTCGGGAVLLLAIVWLTTHPQPDDTASVAASEQEPPGGSAAAGGVQAVAELAERGTAPSAAGTACATGGSRLATRGRRDLKGILLLPATCTRSTTYGADERMRSECGITQPPSEG